jgi:hypothetical protein
MSRPRSEIQEDIRKIVFPGEYGLGKEPGSIPDDTKKAWERVGELVEELEDGLEEEAQRTYGLVRYQITIDVLEELVDNDNSTPSKAEIEDAVMDEVVRVYESRVHDSILLTGARKAPALKLQEVARWKTTG